MCGACRILHHASGFQLKQILEDSRCFFQAGIDSQVKEAGVTLVGAILKVCSDQVLDDVAGSNVAVQLTLTPYIRAIADAPSYTAWPKNKLDKLNAFVETQHGQSQIGGDFKNAYRALPRVPSRGDDEGDAISMPGMSFEPQATALGSISPRV